MGWIIAVSLAIAVGLVWLVWTDGRGAPWVPTAPARVAAMLDLAEVNDADVLYDLGSGDGRVVVAAARDRGARAVGIEVDPIRHLLAQMRVRRADVAGLVDLQRRDFFDVDLGRATVIFCYLLDKTNRVLEDKLRNELRPGTRVVSQSFEFPNLPLEETNGKLFLYRL